MDHLVLLCTHYIKSKCVLECLCINVHACVCANVRSCGCVNLFLFAGRLGVDGSTEIVFLLSGSDRKVHLYREVSRKHHIILPPFKKNQIFEENHSVLDIVKYTQVCQTQG